MSALLKASEGLRRLLEGVALASGWLLVLMACVTTFDVVARKFGVDLPYTKLQELERERRSQGRGRGGPR